MHNKSLFLTNCLLPVLLMMWQHSMSCIHQKHQQKNLRCFWSLVITVSALQEDSRSKQSEKLKNGGDKKGGGGGGGGWGHSNFQLLCDCWNKKEVCIVISYCWVWNMSLNWQRELKSVNATFFFFSFWCLIWKSAVRVGVCWFLSTQGLLHFENLTIKNPSIIHVSLSPTTPEKLYEAMWRESMKLQLHPSSTRSKHKQGNLFFFLSYKTPLTHITNIRSSR